MYTRFLVGAFMCISSQILPFPAGDETHQHNQASFTGLPVQTKMGKAGNEG